MNTSSIVQAIASKVTGTKLKVRIITTSPGNTIKSKKLSDIANDANGTTSSAKTSVCKVPDSYRKAAAASQRWVSELISENSIKLPEAGYYAVDAGMFKQLYIDFQQRVQDRQQILEDLILGSSTQTVTPDPSKAKTVPCFNGWSDFRTKCLSELGNEYKENPDIFPWHDEQDFLAEYTIKLEANPLDTTSTNSKLTEFAQALIQDQTINMSLSLTHSVFAGIHADLERVVTTIQDRCPVAGYEMYSAKIGGAVRSLRVGTTPGKDNSGDVIEVNFNDGTGWQPLTRKSIPVNISSDTDNRFHALQGIGDKYFQAAATKAGMTTVAKRWRDNEKGTAQIEPNTFKFLADTMARANAFFRPNNVEIIDDQPELYKMLDRVSKISANLLTLSAPVSGSNRESKQAIRRAKLAGAVPHVEKALGLVSTFID
jgi:hypothetical protein